MVKATVTDTDITIHCPACGTDHVLPFASGWSFSGTVDSPTILPAGTYQYAMDAGTTTLCHFSVADGQITFYPDCTHELAGQTVPL